MIKQINHVIEQQLFEESVGGMVVLGSDTPNILTGYRSNVAIKKINVKKQLLAEDQAERSEGNIAAPKILTNADAQDEADRQNTASLAAISVKEAIAAAILSIVRSLITNLILRTTNGSDF